MELTDFLNNIAETLEIMNVFSNEEFLRLGNLDLHSLTEIQPLNKKFEILLSHCQSCGKNTAFLSLQNLDHYIDVAKQSVLECRHCHQQIHIHKMQEIRANQGKEYDFLQVQAWKFVKILSKKGLIVQISVPERTISFEFAEDSPRKRLEIEAPANKMKLIQNLSTHDIYHIKIKLFESQTLDLRQALLKKHKSGPLPTIPSYKYQLVSILKVKK